MCFNWALFILRAIVKNNLIHDLVYSQYYYTYTCRNIQLDFQVILQFINFSYRSYKQAECQFVIRITDGHSFNLLFFKDAKYGIQLFEFLRINKCASSPYRSYKQVECQFFTQVKIGHFFQLFHLSFFYKICEWEKYAFVIRITNAYFLKPLHFNSKKFKAYFPDFQTKNKYAFFTQVKIAYFINHSHLRGGLWS